MTSRPFDLRRLALTLSTFAALCLLFGAAQPTSAQGHGPETPRTVIKQLMYADVKEVAPILALLDIKFELAPRQSAIVLRSVNMNDLDTALKLLDNLDTPDYDVELTVFILGGSKEGRPQSTLTPDLQEVTAKLGELFGYRSFELLDTILLRTKDGSAAAVEGSLRQHSEETLYSLSFERVKWIPQEMSSDPETAKQGNHLRFNGLAFKLGPGTDSNRAALYTDIEVREGQKAVLGKATPGGSNGALVLVVEAHAISRDRE